MERLRDSHVCERLYLGNRPVKIALAVVASTFVALFAPSFARAGNTYTVQDLGVVSGDLASEGFAINDAGWTVGVSEPSIGYQKAFLNNGASMIGLVDPYSTEPLSDAYGINSSGGVVGDLDLSVKAGGARNGFLYNGGSWTDLGALVSKGNSYAYAINNHSLVVGTAEASSKTTLYHAVSWDATGRIRDLGTLPGDVSAGALGVNNLDQVVGYSSPSASSGGTEHAFYYDGTSMHNIGTLGGVSAEAAALNDYSHVVGTAQNASGQWDAFLYENGSMQDLGVGEATAVNLYDQVVGDDVADTVGGYGYALDVGHPFLYEDGHRFNLNDLIPANSGWELKTARGINNSGQIVGAGIHNGEYHAYRLDLTLLAKWAPELRYDSRESYRADSAAEMTDWYEPGVGSNLLINGGNGATIAAADPSYPEDDLSLGFLGNIYANGMTSIPEDYIDEIDDNYAADAQAMHGSSLYANQTYAREIDTYNEGIILQYWFFYYYNDRSMYDGLGNHEGDWEMIQVEINRSTGQPVAVTASQHKGGEYCDWSHVQRTADNHPIIYPAWGSHADYFSSGTHIWDAGAVGDIAGGDGESVIPTVEDLGSGPSWLSWPGQWGGSMGGPLPGEEPSPTGPAFHGTQWTDPLTWQSNVSGCTEQQTYQTTEHGVRILRHATSRFGSTLPAAARSTLPVVSAHRVGHRAVIHYYFPRWSHRGGPRPVKITTSVKSSGNRYPPLTVVSTIHGRRGRVSQSIGLGSGSFRILVSVITRSHQSTRVISVPLR